MSRDQVIRILREHEAELKAAGVHHLRLFGSFARDEANEHSDVDLLADLDMVTTPTLFGFIAHKLAISDLLGRDVDLCASGAIRPSVQASVDDEAILVF